jgi:hypothetical protein
MVSKWCRGRLAIRSVTRERAWEVVTGGRVSGAVGFGVGRTDLELELELELKTGSDLCRFGGGEMTTISGDELRNRDDIESGI